ncbi:MAG TPA: GDSL-type esterase/lipase family protein, partial [Thermoleophilia bacterium]|nr:GDSL-type esterase/lipase family protein [Thermoleophilia bacterium]
LDVGVGEIAVTDPLDYPVELNEHYVVSVAVSGGVPSSQGIGNNGTNTAGDVAALETVDGENEPSFRVVKWVAVEGPPQRAVALLGDSIGNGAYALTRDDRLTVVAQAALGFPVVDASAGGDGIERALARIDRDVLQLPSLTDCIVQVGTNDLHRGDLQFMIDNFSKAFQQLRAGGVRAWGATLMPKGDGILSAQAELTRQQMNAFIKSTPLVDGVVDFAAALADPNDPTRPDPAKISRDGIHPNDAGQHAMADAIVAAFRGAR